MKTKKIPMRSCVITHERFPKQELIRVVRTKEGTVCVDETGKMNGKGAYLKKDLSVIEQARKNKILNRVLEVNVEESVYEELEKYVKES